MKLTSKAAEYLLAEKYAGYVVDGKKLEILSIILREYSQGRCVTAIQLGRYVGIRNHHRIRASMRFLRDNGLIAWDGRMTHTIRPTCRFIRAEDL